MDKAIDVSGLTKSYGTFLAVDHISFDVRAGEIFGFLGPNGAGKSTTQRMLTTVLQAHGRRNPDLWARSGPVSLPCQAPDGIGARGVQRLR